MLLTQVAAAPRPLPASPGLAEALPRASEASPGTDFAGQLNQALQDVNRLQLDADHQAQLVASGQAPDLTAAVLAMNRAHLALQLTVAVTNRAVEAYREISRMQV